MDRELEGEIDRWTEREGEIYEWTERDRVR